MLLLGFAAGIGLAAGSFFIFKKKRRKTRKRKSKSTSKMPSITKWLFITTQISALIWIYTSYGMAIYSMLALGQVYTLAEIAEPAITTLLGVTVVKVVENIFEHNNGGIFGTSDEENTQN
jgi:hypothetical protein